MDPRTPPRISKPLSSSTPQVSVFQTPENPPPQQTSKSCLPRPLFNDEPSTFSTKKERREMFRPATPPPFYSCPPKSRVRGHRHFLKAQAVTFNDSGSDKPALTETPLSSTIYDDKKGVSYFEQAYITQRVIGAGCFGKI